MLGRFWRLETGIFLGLWLFFMLAGRDRFFRDPGTFWHVAAGEQILQSSSWLEKDPFSFTPAGRPWIPYEWLGECTMAGLHRLGGLDTLLLATVTLLALLYTWAARRLIRAGLHPSLALVLVALTLAASTSNFHVRPHLTTLVGMGITVAVLCDFEAGRRGTRSLLLLVPLYVAWTNTHGGVLGGLGTLTLAVAGWTFAHLMNRPGPLIDRRQALGVGLCLLVCGLTVLVNPYGARLPRTWLEIMASPLLPHLIQEHARLSLASLDGVMVVILFGVYLAVLAGVWPSWPRVTWLLPLVWFCLACSRVRHGPLFGITTLVVLADMVPHTRWAARLAQARSDLFQIPAQATSRRFCWQAALLPAGVVAAALLLQVGQVGVPILGAGWARLDRNVWPVELLPELRRYELLQAGGTPIFNECNLGGFLIYHTPGYRVFVDDRFEVYRDAWLEDYVRAGSEDTAGSMARWADRYGSFPLALTLNGSGFDRYFSGSADWALIQRTSVAALYRRRAASHPREAVAARTGILPTGQGSCLPCRVEEPTIASSAHGPREHARQWPALPPPLPHSSGRRPALSPILECPRVSGTPLSSALPLP